MQVQIWKNCLGRQRLADQIGKDIGSGGGYSDMKTLALKRDARIAELIRLKDSWQKKKKNSIASDYNDNDNVDMSPSS